MADKEQLRRLERSGAALAVLDSLGNDLGTPEQRVAYLRKLDYFAFKDLLCTLNSALTRATGFADGRKRTPSLPTPPVNSRDHLLSEGLRSAQEIAADETLPPAERLTHAARTLAGSIIYVHAFADGNGRTARALSLALAGGYRETDARSRASIVLAISEMGGHFWTPVSRRVLPAAAHATQAVRWGALGVAPLGVIPPLVRGIDDLPDRIPQHLKADVAQAVKISTLPIVTELVKAGRLNDFVVDDGGTPALDVDRWLAFASREELYGIVATAEEMVEEAIVAFQRGMVSNDLTVSTRGVHGRLPVRVHLDLISAQYSQALRSDVDPITLAQSLGASF